MNNTPYYPTVFSVRFFSRCQGSATVECILLITLLLPVCFGMVMLGKLIDLRQTGEQASRYAVWQTTVASRASLPNHQNALISERFYTNPSSLIDSRRLNPVSDRTGLKPLWAYTGMPVADSVRSPSRIEIESQDAVLVDYAFDLPAATVASGLSQQVGNMSTLLGGLSGNTWDISGNGFVRANLDIGVQANPGLMHSNAACRSTESGHCIQSSAVIMSDGWSAGSEELAKKRVQSFLPSTAFQPIGDAVAQIGGSLLFPELRGLKDAFGYVDMSVLPAYARR